MVDFNKRQDVGDTLEGIQSFCMCVAGCGCACPGPGAFVTDLNNDITYTGNRERAVQR